MTMRTASPRQSHQQRRHESPRSPLHASLSEKQRDHPLYHSPRCDSRFHDVVIENPATDESLQTHEGRWNFISEQAGSHRQDGSLMVIPRRVSPKALRLGTPPLASARVRSLHVPINQTDNLPEWLDTISSIFFNLEHLYLTDANKSSSNQSNEKNRRMRRLYVIYRLPHLTSINGKLVKESERQVARPMSPSGHKVKREEWICFQWPGQNTKNESSSTKHCCAEEKLELKSKKRNAHQKANRTRGLTINTDLDTNKRDREKPHARANSFIGLPTAAKLADSKYNNKVKDHYSPMAGCEPAEDSVVASCGVVPLPYFNQLSIEQNKPRLRTLSEDVRYSPKLQSSPKWNNQSKPRIKRANSAPNSPTSLSFAEASDLRNSQNLRFVEDEPRMGTIQTASSSSDTECNTQRGDSLPSVKRMASASLSSPFPMQFREKPSPQRKNSSNPVHELVMPPLASNTSVDNKVDSNQMPMSPSFFDRKLSKPGKGRVDPPGDKAVVFPSTKADARKERAIEHNSKPPKCPSSRRIVPTTPQSYKKRNRKKLGNILKVKSKSIIEFDDEDSSTEEEDSSS
eukprot:CAMPEP_0195283140 /NCGR_PEP_ID=MMETSP0707-20130614/1785_1 /TAXON_ID=33640 /ORGANISM="Asterionellopsis glacialis, Strain CCMP134" /LENGTH=571 /DNA_ID=CAMNT_0040342259 /DNA_START=133 /DNA_END=1848 /DNA_ORIENTATION=-